MDVVSVTSPIDFWSGFLKLKVGGVGRRHLSSASLQDNRKWAKRREVGGAGCWNLSYLADSGDSSGNPPVTQVAMPLIMQNFKA